MWSISGTGVYLPPTCVTNAELERQLMTTDQWIVEHTGIRERRIATTETASTMAVEAARQAIDRAGIKAHQVNAIILATTSYDFRVPSTAALVAHELGMTGAVPLDLCQATCAGFLYALILADKFIRTGAEHVLIIGAELMSQLVDPNDRLCRVIFGDGAGAAVISRRSGDHTSGLLAHDWGCRHSMAVAIPGGGSRFPTSPGTLAENLHTIRMDGRAVWAEAVERFPTSIETVTTAAGLSPQDLDLVILHQSNLRIIEATLARLGLPKLRAYTNVERYGNTSAASIPIALHEALLDQRIPPGGLVAFSALGAGLLWASALIRWPN